MTGRERSRARTGMGVAVRQLLEASRPFSWIDTALPFLAAGFAAERALTLPLVLGTLYFLLPYNLLLYGVNDLFDYASDVANPRKRSIEGGLLPPDRRRSLWLGVAVTNVPFVVALGFVGGPAVAAALLVTVVVAVAYSAPPVRTKERPFLDSLTSALHFALPAACGFLVGGMAPADLPWIVLGGFVAWGIASHALGAIQDIAYDRAAGIGSIAIALGARGTAVVSLAGYVVAVVAAASLGPLGLLAAIPLALYLLLPAMVLCAPGEPSARRAWRGFLGMNLLVGFLLTQLLLRVWGLTTYTPVEIAVASGIAAAGFVLASVLATRVATARRAPLAGRDDQTLPSVTAVVPCRDEAPTLASCLRALVAQDHPRLDIVVVDDGSSDGSPSIARRVLDDSAAAGQRGGRVIGAGPAPDGWAGKGWAVRAGVEAAAGDLVLIVDADTVLEPFAARCLASELIAGRHDLVSGVTRYDMRSAVERALIPGFPMLLFGFLPLWLVALTGGRPASLAFAYGPLVLIRRAAYLATGGHAVLPGRAREDVDLARTFARSGRRVGTVYAADLGATRHYRSPADVRRAWIRILFPYAGESPAVAVTAIAGFSFAYLLPLALPVAGLATGDPTLLSGGSAALALLVAARAALAWTQRQPLVTLLWHPVTAVATAVSQLVALAHGIAGRPFEWRGRTLPSAALAGGRR